MITQKSISRTLTILLVVMVLQMGIAPAQPVSAAATFTVNSTLDQPDDLTIPGTCHTAANTCTLRAAIMQANRSTGVGATIIVPAGIYQLTIPAAGTNGEENGDLFLAARPSGDPVITISGAGAGKTIIDANQLDRVLRISTERTAIISGVTIRNGYLAAGYGGGIYNSGTLTITNSTISLNNSGLSGGGIYNTGGLTVTNSTISQNNADSFGGGIYNGGTLTVTNSTISLNNTDALGGGIYNGGTLTVKNSTVSRNNATHGGGISNAGNLILSNTTISQNNANTDGGGIYNFTDSANVYNTSIVFNGADADADFNGSGGGVYNEVGGTVNLRNTLVAGNKTRGLSRDCSGTLGSYGRNLFKSVIDCTIVTGSGSWTYIDSLDTIGPLSNNGGPTWTHALLPGSNAIDGGDPVLGCLDSNSVLLTSDQRGAARVSGALCDIGAYELHDTLPLKSTAAQDGWVLESGENTNKGWRMNSTLTTLRLGDDAARKQYRSLLSFATGAALPDNAVITRVTLKVKRQGVIGGGDPVIAFQGFLLDIRKGTFGTAPLQITDWQALAQKTIGPAKPPLVGGWYSFNLTGVSAYINKLATLSGVTQIRLRFKLDDNNNAAANYLSLYSGNAPIASRPQLIIEYYIP